MVCMRVCEEMKSRLLDLRWQLGKFIQADSVWERKRVERGTRRHLVDRVMAPPGHKSSQPVKSSGLCRLPMSPVTTF